MKKYNLYQTGYPSPIYLMIVFCYHIPMVPKSGTFRLFLWQHLNLARSYESLRLMSPINLGSLVQIRPTKFNFRFPQQFINHLCNGRKPGQNPLLSQVHLLNCNSAFCLGTKCMSLHPEAGQLGESQKCHSQIKTFINFILQ